MARVFEPQAIYGSVLNQKDKSYEHLHKQLLRSGTSIGANVSEDQSASSKKDFIYKLPILLKEARESQFWLRLLKETEIINKQKHESLNRDCD